MLYFSVCSCPQPLILLQFFGWLCVLVHVFTCLVITLLCRKITNKKIRTNISSHMSEWKQYLSWNYVLIFFLHRYGQCSSLAYNVKAENSTMLIGEWRKPIIYQIIFFPTDLPSCNFPFCVCVHACVYYSQRHPSTSRMSTWQLTAPTVQLSMKKLSLAKTLSPV